MMHGQKNIKLQASSHRQCFHTSRIILRSTGSPIPWFPFKPSVCTCISCFPHPSYASVG